MVAYSGELVEQINVRTFMSYFLGVWLERVGLKTWLVALSAKWRSRSCCARKWWRRQGRRWCVAGTASPMVCEGEMDPLWRWGS